MEIYEVVAKIDGLCKERGWSTYKLAEEAGITPSTMFNMRSRGTLPSIITLNSICNAFGITLAEFFADGECDDLSEAERELVRKYRKLDFRGKKAVRAVTDVLSEKGTDGKK